MKHQHCVANMAHLISSNGRREGQQNLDTSSALIAVRLKIHSRDCFEWRENCSINGTSFNWLNLGTRSRSWPECRLRPAELGCEDSWVLGAGVGQQLDLHLFFWGFTMTEAGKRLTHTGVRGTLADMELGEEAN